MEKNSENISQITKNIVQQNAMQTLKEKSVHFVKFVGNLCDLCATDFVQSIVAISEVQEGLENQEELQVMQDFTTNYRKCILLQNLVRCVESLDNIDTTQTTTNLLKLFGSANRVITKYIQETKKSESTKLIYQAKASKKERNLGCEELEEKLSGAYEFRNRESGKGQFEGKTNTLRANNHPTVKPIKLMRYLCRLVTPKGGTVLDPFMGSGTTGISAIQEGFDFIGIELDKDYFKIAETRINNIK